MDEFNVEEVDHEFTTELAKEQLLADFELMFDTHEESKYCDSCAINPAYGGKCNMIAIVNNYITRYNGVHGVLKIQPVENRWGCTNHEQKKEVETF